MHVEHTEVTGLSLKVQRVADRVKGTQVAEAMGVTPSRVYDIERAAFVSPDVASRYLDAVRKCSTRRTTAQAA